MLISNYALFHFSSSRVSRLRMFTSTHHGALISYDNAKLKGRKKMKKIEIFKTESLLLFSEVYIFCTNMCFLTTVCDVYQLKNSGPTKTMSSESPNTLLKTSALQIFSLTKIQFFSFVLISKIQVQWKYSFSVVCCTSAINICSVRRNCGSWC